MDSEDKLFQTLKRPSLQEMINLMNQFHSSDEYLYGNSSFLAEERSARKLKEYGWDFTEYCIAIGSL